METKQSNPTESNPHENMDEFFMKHTSVAEARNDKWKAICSEVVDEFIYLGADHVA